MADQSSADHDAFGQPEAAGDGPSRRAVLAKVAVGTGALWAAPSIVSLGPAAFAQVGSARPGRTFTVDSRTDGSGRVFANSGITVVAGQQYTVTVTGSAAPGTGFTYGPDGEPGTAGDSKKFDGTSNEVIDSTYNYFAIIARVGDGPTFLVGKGTTFTAAADGTLLFAYNDSVNGFGDNSGTFLAAVTP